MTGSVSIAGTDVALGVMPFSPKGKRPRKKPQAPKKSNWKELTVWVNPWKKAGTSQYQLANACVGCESLVFGEPGFRIEEAIAICAETVLAKHRIPEAQAPQVMAAVERVFEEWQRKSVAVLAQKAVEKLNQMTELEVLQAHAMVEGAEADLAGLAPAFHLDDGLMVNPGYLPVLEAITGSSEPFSVLETHAMFEPEPVPTEPMARAIHKIAATFKLVP